VSSQDTNLLYLVLLTSRRALCGSGKSDVFDSLLRKHDVARVALQTYYRDARDDERLEASLKRFRDKFGLGDFRLARAYEAVTLNQRLERMRDVKTAFEKFQQKFEADSIERQIRLLRLQQDLEETTGERHVFVDTSVSETIYNCIVLSQHKKAERVRQIFEVPDRRFYYIKIRALSECADWKMLERFANEMRPPIGFVPFARAAIRRGEKLEASKYIMRVEDDRVRLELLVEIEFWIEAADLAVRIRDASTLGVIVAECSKVDEKMARKIEKMARRAGFGVSE